jgi:hypothetical protein
VPRKKRANTPAARDAAARKAFRAAIQDRCRPYHADYYICEACGCRTNVIEAHHIRKVRYGDNTPENGMGVCPSCHLWIETHPKDAKAKGWSK